VPSKPISQDRVHAINHAHPAQELREFKIFDTAHPPHLHGTVQNRIFESVGCDSQMIRIDTA
jgi:hypothetical protein